MGLKRWGILAALLPALAPQAALAQPQTTVVGAYHAARLDHVIIRGKLIDRTCNHGEDRRIWSRSLFQKRDLYIYLPPNYDEHTAYPVMLFLHGFATDETSFLRVVPVIDDAICKGKLPPMIVAAPDGSLDGQGSCHRPGSFWINSNAGPYEDFLLLDVWDYLTHHYSIRSDRGAHILAGASMGGFGAFNLGIRHRDCFGIVMGIHPPVNLRWQDCVGNTRAEFDPHKWGWRTIFDTESEVLARFGLVAVRMGDVVRPVFGFGEDATAGITANNPIELVDRTHLRNGELAMFIAYGGKDQFNLAAQVESFMYLCKHRGIGLHVAYDPAGRHDLESAERFLPLAINWLNAQLGSSGIGGAYSPATDVDHLPSRPAILP